MSNLAQRDFLKNLGALSAASLTPGWARGATDTAALARQFKLGAISDGFSMDFEEALKLMKGYGLKTGSRSATSGASTIRRLARSRSRKLKT